MYEAMKQENWTQTLVEQSTMIFTCHAMDKVEPKLNVYVSKIKYCTFYVIITI